MQTDSRSAEDILRRQNEELDALYETMLGLINRLDQHSLLEAIVARAASLIETPHAYLYVVEKGVDGEPRLVVRAGVGYFENQIGYSLRCGEGLSGRVWETGAIFNIDDYAAWPDRRHDFDRMEIHALVGIPLFAHGEIVGVIGLGHFEKGRTVTSEEVALLDRFGKLASLTLENAHLYAAAQQELAERKQVEAALTASEGHYRMLMEQASEGIYLTALDGAFLEVNRVGYEMCGYTREEILRRNLWDLASPEDLALHPPRRDEMLSGQALTLERIMVRKDGSTFHAETSTKQLPDGRVLVTARDITDRKAAEQRLEEQAVQQTQLLTELLTAQEAERRRLSMELHDGPLQSLGVLLLATDRMVRRNEREEYSMAAQELQNARDLILVIVDEVRALLSDLSLEVLTSYGLIPALRDHIDRYSEVTGILVSLQNPLEERLPPYIELLMYRLVQESLANARKHAGATRVGVSFLLADNYLTHDYLGQRQGVRCDQAVPEAACGREDRPTFDAPAHP